MVEITIAGNDSDQEDVNAVSPQSTPLGTEQQIRRWYDKMFTTWMKKSELLEYFTGESEGF